MLYWVRYFTHLLILTLIGWDAASWTFFSISVSSTTNKKNNFAICILIHQLSGHEFAEWVYDLDFEDYIGRNGNYMHRIGFGFQGLVSEVYMTRYFLRTPKFHKQIGMSRNKQLYPWFETAFEDDIFWVSGGCGNGIVNSTLDPASEEWDDANNVDGDGWSSTCTVEDLWECDTNPFIDISE